MRRNRPKMFHGPLTKEQCLALGTCSGYPPPITLADIDARLAVETKATVRDALQASRDYIVSLGYTHWTAEDGVDSLFGRQRRQPKTPIQAHSTTNHFTEHTVLEDRRHILGNLVEDLTPFTPIPKHKGLGGGNPPIVKHYEVPTRFEIEFEIHGPNAVNSIECRIEGDRLAIDFCGDAFAYFGQNEHAKTLKYLQAFFAKYGWKAGR
jgi:hypothetical protein